MPPTDPAPEDWRAVLASWDYPDDARTGTRRQRRQAKRQHRQDARRHTADWVREERRRDPIRPGCALVGVLLVLAVGAGARYLSTPDTPAAQPSTSAAPADAKPPATPAPDPATSSAPALATVDMTTPDAVAAAAIRGYLTRNPPADNGHAASVRRAAPYMTRSLVTNLTASADPAYGRLVSRGGVAVVSRTTVGPAGASLPVDTPLRVWRTVTARVDVTGYEDYSETVTLRTEVISTGREWRVARILGL
ncbi:hypothetical protein [Streptomyces sp. CAI 127]|uniref:hypothetical protein n=1 Tax=Streptomyces sp. CAI 127 TaxID=1076397 RepID=UPI001587EE13|nr:hypothetical protein [Streptomyces sp. CAI 127]NUW02899.1 hypothetical protein [Streptomyces sp. CAI 127]